MNSSPHHDGGGYVSFPGRKEGEEPARHTSGGSPKFGAEPELQVLRGVSTFTSPPEFSPRSQASPNSKRPAPPRVPRSLVAFDVDKTVLHQGEADEVERYRRFMLDH